MPSNKPLLSVIIPAYNEADRLPLTLVDIDRHLSTRKYTYEILVVDDGSKDGTAEVAKKFIKLIPNLRVTGYEQNQGKGAAVRAGMLEARGKYRLFTDSDNSTSIDHFDKMLPFLREGYDIVIGSRDVQGAQMHPPQSLLKRILGNLGNLYVQLLLLPGIRDTQCGFKVFTEEAAERIFVLQRIKRWGFDVEALALGKRMGYRIKEIPAYWVNDADSRVKPMAYFQVLWEAFKVRWWLWHKKYSLGAK
ncbi:MAG: glycosyltransferase family 2 protein [bacterium]|nr:glycosyltransferase family 2 protein [bacterium]